MKRSTGRFTESKGLVAIKKNSLVLSGKQGQFLNLRAVAVARTRQRTHLTIGTLTEFCNGMDNTNLTYDKLIENIEDYNLSTTVNAEYKLYADKSIWYDNEFNTVPHLMDIFEEYYPLLQNALQSKGEILDGYGEYDYWFTK